MPTILVAAIVLVFPALMLTAAASDALTFRIPNWISLALIAAFPLAAFAVGASWTDVGLCVASGVVGLVIGMILWALRWIGGGDAKVFAAGALWIGWPAVGVFAVGTMIAGGALALLLTVFRSAPFRPLVMLGPPWVLRLAEPKQGVPYGVAISLGGLLAFVQSRYGVALGIEL
jgi:prepilin peptidase CpaA